MDHYLEACGTPPPAPAEHTPPILGPHPLAVPSTATLSVPEGPPSGGVMVTLVALTVILMAYSVVAGIMGDTALAATAGGGAIALIGEIARRLLAAGRKA